VAPGSVDVPGCWGVRGRASRQMGGSRKLAGFVGHNWVGFGWLLRMVRQDLLCTEGQLTLLLPKPMSTQADCFL
jgi:hypothetical protein